MERSETQGSIFDNNFVINVKCDRYVIISDRRKHQSLNKSPKNLNFFYINFKFGTHPYDFDSLVILESYLICKIYILYKIK